MWKGWCASYVVIGGRLEPELLNRRALTDYQSEMTRYQYDSTNRLVALRNPAYLQVSYHYDGAGRLLNRILSNGAQTDYRYDPDNRLVGLKNRSADGTVVEDLAYQRDRVGNITQISDAASGRTVYYGYDPLYRLTRWTAPTTARIGAIRMMPSATGQC